MSVVNIRKAVELDSTPQRILDGEYIDQLFLSHCRLESIVLV